VGEEELLVLTSKDFFPDCGVFVPDPPVIRSNSAATYSRDLLSVAFLGLAPLGEEVRPAPDFLFNKLLKKFWRTPSPAGLPLVPSPIWTPGAGVTGPEARLSKGF
jgi:hypothetical protein